MPATKLASFRYRVIDSCLSNRNRKWTMEDLINKVSEKLEEEFFIEKGVSKRTLQYDINVMRSAHPRGFDAPILCEQGYYSYEDPEFSIANSPFNADDLNDLQEAISVLKQFKGLPHMESMYGIVGKLESEMSTFNTSAKSPILFDTNDGYAGVQWIEPLFKAIKEEKCIQIKYQPFSLEAPMDFKVHPYLLKEYNNRWFMFGLNDAENLIYNFPLDRIQGVKNAKGKFNEQGKTQTLHYFDHIIGVTLPRDAKVELIQLEVDPELLPYVVTKPVHKSQKISEGKKGSILELNLIINPELTFWIMQYADKITVVKPIALKKTIADKITQASKRYKG
jgi:predicted DNA-binding transcriptional regulator YafY